MSSATDSASSSDGHTPGAGGGGVFEMLARATGVLATLLCGALILTTTFSVVVYQRGITISWLDDLLRMLLIWSVFLGSITPVWRRDHITMDAIYTRFSPGTRRLVDLLVAVVGMLTCGFVAWVSLSTTAREYSYQTLLSSGELPAWTQTFSITFSFALMTVAYLGVLIATIAGRPAPRPGPTQ